MYNSIIGVSFGIILWFSNATVQEPEQPSVEPVETEQVETVPEHYFHTVDFYNPQPIPQNIKQLDYTQRTKVLSTRAKNNMKEFYLPKEAHNVVIHVQTVEPISWNMVMYIDVAKTPWKIWYKCGGRVTNGYVTWHVFSFDMDNVRTANKGCRGDRESVAVGWNILKLWWYHGRFDGNRIESITLQYELLSTNE